MSTHYKIRREVRPTADSIHWIPRGGSHYVVASLQPGDGGRRQLFVAQRVLVQLDALARSDNSQTVLGLLLGGLFDCPASFTRYLVIDDLVASTHTGHDSWPTSLERALSELSRRVAVRVMGWYCSSSEPDFKPSASQTSAHLAYLTEPWQALTIVGGGHDHAAASFALYDNGAKVMFRAPFYEVFERTGYASVEAKPTVIAWPTYTTSDVVTAAPRTPVSVPQVAVVRAKPAWRTWLDRAAPNAPVEPRPSGPNVPATASPVDVRPARPRHGSNGGAPRAAPPMAAHRPVTDLPISDQAAIGDTDDSASGDSPARYLAIAQRDGFFVVARFDAEVVGETGERETLWLLSDPWAGLLLTVVTTDSIVVDASLHYNIRMKDPAVLDVAFPEHRNVDTQTVYMRENCVDLLRTRCARLRSTEAVQKTWSVSPVIFLLTPSEWQVLSTDEGHSADGEDGIAGLNRRRMALLPDAFLGRT